MDIKTNFDVGDKVWVLYESGAIRVVINHISTIIVGELSPSVWYHFSKMENGKSLKRHEDDCFGTLEELLEHISKSAQDLTIEELN